MYFEMSDRERTLYYKKVLHWYTKAAEQGHSAAQFDLGMLYYTGSGVAVDDTQALDWITKSAKGGYLPAHNVLGYAYHNGYGVEQNYSKSYMWYTIAKKQDDDTACLLYTSPSPRD